MNYDCLIWRHSQKALRNAGVTLDHLYSWKIHVIYVIYDINICTNNLAISYPRLLMLTLRIIEAQAEENCQ